MLFDSFFWKPFHLERLRKALSQLFLSLICIYNWQKWRYWLYNNDPYLTESRDLRQRDKLWNNMVQYYTATFDRSINITKHFCLHLSWSCDLRTHVAPPLSHHLDYSPFKAMRVNPGTGEQEKTGTSSEKIGFEWTARWRMEKRKINRTHRHRECHQKG